MFVNGRFPVGAKLRVKSHVPGIYHYGIAGYPIWAGGQEVIHNTRERGVHISTLYEFSEGITTQPMWGPSCLSDGVTIYRRAYRQLGKPYDLFSANCEHFVNWAITGVQYSQQLSVAVLALGLGLTATFIARR